MTNDFNNDGKELSFKEQILRDLEKVKKQRSELETSVKAKSNDNLMDTTELAVFNKLKGLSELDSQSQVNTVVPTAAPFVRPTAEATEAPQVRPTVLDTPVPTQPPVVRTSAPTVAPTTPSTPQPVTERPLSKLEASAPGPVASTVAPVTPPPVKTERIKPVYVEDELPEVVVEQMTEAGTEVPHIAVVPNEEASVAALSKKKGKKAKKAKRTATEDEQLTRRSKKSRQNSIARRIVMVLSLIILIALGLTAVVGYNWIQSSLNPIDTQATEYIAVEIPVGSTTSDIGDILEDEGLIKNGTVFNFYSKLRNYANFQSGYFNLQKSMTLDEIAQTLQEAGTDTPQEPVLGKITIPEGYTLTQIAKAVAKNTDKASTPFTEKEFMEKVQDETFISEMVSKYPDLLSSLPKTEDGVKYRLEGYLYPATYEYTKSSDIESLIEQMIAALDTNLDPYYASIAATDYSVNEILTLASLVEKEGSTDEDRKNIASVFYNRIAIGQALQSNIAILYAMDQLGEKTTLAEDAGIDTSIDSPYNIYVNAGLMPGPVDSASLSAIEAVVAPNETDYYYFVADVTTGDVYFAETYEEHDVNVQQYVNSNLTMGADSDNNAE